MFTEKVKKFLQEFYYDDELGKKQFKYGTQLVSPRVGYGELGWNARTYWGGLPCYSKFGYWRMT